MGREPTPSAWREDRLGIMVGDGKTAFGRRRSADAGIRRVQQTLLLRRRRPRRRLVGHLSALRRVHGSDGAMGTPVAVQEEVEYGLVSLNNI